jgi:signal transduction histidine kinase
VFRNLLSNAIRYRRESGAEVQVSAARDGECWHFVVADNGPGIAPWQHERIWRLFQTTRPKEGTGIGLAIVKRLVDSHGGRVYVESEEGRGARFHVLWPASPRTFGRADS